MRVKLKIYHPNGTRRVLHGVFRDTATAINTALSYWPDAVRISALRIEPCN